MLDRNELIRTVTALQSGDKNAAGVLYDHYYDGTYYFIKSMVIDPELAADLAQDCFVEVLDKITSLQEPAAFVSWIRQIAYHKSTNHFKKSKSITVDEDEDGFTVFDTLEEDRTEFIPDAALDQEDLKNTILSMLLELPETQRSALVLHYYEEHSVKQIAQIQGVSEGTVKSRLNYGRNAIKQSVESYEKKNGIKLHCAGIVPLLLWLFGQGVLVRNTTVVAGTAAGATVSVAAGAKAAGVAAAKTAVTAKIIGAVALSAVVIGSAAFGIAKLTKKPDTSLETAETTELTEETEESEQVQTDPMMPQPEGNYKTPYLYMDYTEAPVYTKDGHIFYHGAEGPVQLTQFGYDMQAEGYFPYRQFVKFSEDMRYVYYPDHIIVSGYDIYNDVRFDLYFRDLSDSNAQPVKIGENIQEYQISPDGLRIVYKYYSIGGFTVCDLSTTGILQTYLIESGFDLGGQTYPWNEDLTLFVYEKLEDPFGYDENRQLYVWKDGTSHFICDYVGHVTYCFTEKGYDLTHLYYTDLDKNLYHLDTSTMESTWCMADVSLMQPVDEKDGFNYYTISKSHPYSWHQAEFYEDLIDYDTQSVELDYHGELPEGVGLVETLDYYYYCNGEAICVAEDVLHYEKFGDVTITGKFYRENMEKVSLSQYGEDAGKEALRRLYATFRWCIQSPNDTLYLELSPDTRIWYNRETNCVEYYVDHSLGMPDMGPRDTYILSMYTIPVNNGMFGEKQVIDYPVNHLDGNFDPDYPIYAMYTEDESVHELYINQKKMPFAIYSNVIIYNRGVFCCTQFDPDTGLGTWSLVYEDRQEVIAEDAYISTLTRHGDDLYYLLADVPGSQTGDLYLYRNGTSTLLDSNVQLDGYLVY